jgi:hypothetical protein
MCLTVVCVGWLFLLHHFTDILKITHCITDTLLKITDITVCVGWLFWRSTLRPIDTRRMPGAVPHCTALCAGARVRVRGLSNAGIADITTLLIWWRLLHYWYNQDYYITDIIKITTLLIWSRLLHYWCAVLSLERRSRRHYYITDILKITLLHYWYNDGDYITDTSNCLSRLLDYWYNWLSL